MFPYLMFACLVIGIRNIRKAFVAGSAARGSWTYINWLLLVSGIIVIIIGFFCFLETNKMYKERKKEAEEKAKEEQELRKKQFYYDTELYKGGTDITDSVRKEDQQ